MGYPRHAMGGAEHNEDLNEGVGHPCMAIPYRFRSAIIAYRSSATSPPQKFGLSLKF